VVDTLKHGKVLVLDSDQRAALAVIRSLGSKGIEVTAGHHRPANMGFSSKYCSHRVRYPDPTQHKTMFVKALASHLQKHSYDVVFPISDYTMWPVSEHKEELERSAAIAAPDIENAMKALDKSATVKIAAEHGIPHPKTVIPDNTRDFRRTLETMNYPLVIKARMKPLWADDKAIILNVTRDNYAYSPQDALDKYERILSRVTRSEVKEKSPLMIQEYAVGDGYGVEALVWKSQVKAVFVHRRLREYPITGGGSTLRESVKNDYLTSLGTKMLVAMDWEGVAMVEFKLGLPNNANLMEVNGRFWGSLPLAVNAGVDFPYLLFSCMTEGDCDNQMPPHYEVGLKQRWFLYGDMMWLVMKLLHDGWQSQTLKEFALSLTVPDDVIVFDDPRPAIGAMRTSLDILKDLRRGKINLAGERNA
jgi:predicted ATP-grasp superfamily ATP-dependent carboligase